MWFGPGVQVVAHVPVAGPTKNKFLLVILGCLHFAQKTSFLFYSLVQNNLN